MHAPVDPKEQFRAFIEGLCGTAPAVIIADGKWHRFRIADTRSKGSRPGAYLLHLDSHPLGLFMDWRQQDKRYRWTMGGEVSPVDLAEWKRLGKEGEERRVAGNQRAAAAALTFFQKNCGPATDHPYLTKKQIRAHGARIGSSRPFFGPEDEQPCLIVPIRGPDNKALTIQAIRGDGERRFWKGCTTEGGYCLIGSAKADGPIVLCEGFATAASIHEATGLLVVATFSATNMVRVSRWAGHRFPGRTFIAAGDDDWHLAERGKLNEGKEAAIKAARNLGGRAVFPNMHGLVTDGGDDFNDMAREIGIADVRAVFLGEPESGDEQSTPGQDAEDFGPQPERAALKLLSPSVWEGKPIPVRQWRLHELIPMRQAVLFTGAGAVGKSLVNQQMTTCIAMGVPFLGVRTLGAPALYITCEDDDDELHSRQAAICYSMGIPLGATAGRVFLLSLYGELGNGLCSFDADGEMVISERYHQIVESCRANGIRHVTLDNTAHLFTGNEINRYHVASFVNLCNRLARDIDGTVVIIGHPNKAGDSYSGSTAWENQVRSRIFMETPVGEDGIVVDPDLRVLRNEKANYARRNSEVRFYWFKGAFVLESDLAPEDRKSLAESAAENHDNELFLKLLEQLTKEKRHVSHSPNAGNFAPKIMAQMSDSRGASASKLRAAMERLFRDEKIEAGQELWLGADRHPVIGVSLWRGKP